MPKIEDRRIRKTKKQIRLGLADLLLTKSIDSITVKELVDTADINRSTFYLHYNNVHTLMETVENEIISDIEKIAYSYPAFDRIGSHRKIRSLVQYIYENHEIVRALIGPNGDPDFIHRIQRIFTDECIYSINKNADITLSDDFEIALSFCLSGCTGIFTKWLNQALPFDDNAYFAETVYTLVYSTLSNYITR